jgi:hypothetical protein
MNTETKQQKTMETKTTKTKKQIMKFLFKHMDKKTRDEYKDSLTTTTTTTLLLYR